MAFPTLFNTRAVNIDCLDFEFGGGDTVAIISIPAEDKWDAVYPWASGRRKEILTIVAEEVQRTQAPSSTIVWEDNSFRLVKK